MHLGEKKGQFRRRMVVSNTYLASKKSNIVGHEEGKSVNCLLFSNKGNYLFSGGNDRNIIQWDLASGSPIFRIEVSRREPVFSLGLENEGSGDLLAVGTFSIKLWDLSSLKKSKKFVGNSNPVSLLGFKDGFILGCANERFLHLFKVETDAVSGENTTNGKEVPIHEFACEGKVICLDFFINRIEESEGDDKKKKKKKTKLKTIIQISLVALTDNNSIHMWKYDPVANVVLQSKLFKLSDSESKQPGKVLHCAFIPQVNNAAQVNGTSKSGNGTLDISALLSIDLQGTFKPTFKRIALTFGTSATNHANTDNANIEIIPVLSSDISASSKPLTKSSSTGVSANNNNAASAPVAAKRVSNLDGTLNAVIPQSSLTFQELLLASNKNEISSDPENDDDEQIEESTKTPKDDETEQENNNNNNNNNNNDSTPFNLPKVDSLSNALLQALISKDKQLLEQTLSSATSVAGKALVDPTVMKLPAGHVIELLTVLVEKVYSSPQRGAHLIMWIQSVLVHHTGKKKKIFLFFIFLFFIFFFLLPINENLKIFFFLYYSL
jgi:hypothetical protein